MFCNVRSGCKFHARKSLSLSKIGNFSLSFTSNSSNVSVSQSAALQEDYKQSAAVTTHDPLAHEDFFGVRKLFTMKDLFENRVHLGHNTGTRNDYMKKYLYGTRLKQDIIDLDQTLPLLHDALNITAHIAFCKGIILFVSRNRQTMPLVERTAIDCGEYAHCRYWQGGLFTNATIQYGAVTRLPDLCIFIHTLNNVFKPNIGMVNATKMNIPTIGILDTNCDPRLITYPVPGNDDSPCAVELYCSLFKQAVMLGKQKRSEMEKQKLIGDSF